MAHRRQPPYTHTHKIVTPVTGEAQQLPPLTFGSYLPAKFQSIAEESNDNNLEDEIQLEDAIGKDTPKRLLHFPDVGTSTHPTPAYPESVKGNRSNGKILNFIPP